MATYKLSQWKSVAALLCIVVGLGATAHIEAHPQNNTVSKGATVTNHATGPFEVKLAPQKPDNPAAEAANLGRMSFDKQYHGDLEAIGKGEMLAITPDAKGSGVYVALERVTGTLKGRNGSFVLHHRGIMTRGAPQLTIEVAPDSGTGQLEGISGKVNINIAAGGKHTYDFEYSLPETR